MAVWIVFAVAIGAFVVVGDTLARVIGTVVIAVVAAGVFIAIRNARRRHT